MKRIELKKIASLPYFTKETLRSISAESDTTISMNIHRWIANGDIISLKKGMYMTSSAHERFSRVEGFHEYIANILLNPSYVSLEYVLAKYGILTEMTYPVTSVTLKTGRSFSNKLATFSYKKISAKLFEGYERKSFLGHEYLVASKAKALFDYLYYRKDVVGGKISAQRDLVEEFRLNLEGFGSYEFSRALEYAAKARSKKVLILIEHIIQNAPDRG